MFPLIEYMISGHKKKNLTVCIEAIQIFRLIIIYVQNMLIYKIYICLIYVI